MVRIGRKKRRRVKEIIIRCSCTENAGTDELEGKGAKPNSIWNGKF